MVTSITSLGVPLACRRTNPWRMTSLPAGIDDSKPARLAVQPGVGLAHQDLAPPRTPNCSAMQGCGNGRLITDRQETHGDLTMMDGLPALRAVSNMPGLVAPSRRARQYTLQADSERFCRSRSRCFAALVVNIIVLWNTV